MPTAVHSVAIALVTGGSRGIGAAIARRLAAAGADVALTYHSGEENARKTVAEIEALCRRGPAVRADSAEAGETTSAVHRAAGRLDERPHRRHGHQLSQPVCGVRR